jgi:hypothetical protein
METQFVEVRSCWELYEFNNWHIAIRYPVGGEWVKKYKIMTQDENASDEELDDYGDYVLELSQAHGELGLAYDEARRDYPQYPSFDEKMVKTKQ